jgi:hypothetical protein
MTGSYRSSTSGETLFAVTDITFDSSNAGDANGRVFLIQFCLKPPLPGFPATQHWKEPRVRLSVKKGA